MKNRKVRLIGRVATAILAAAFLFTDLAAPAAECFAPTVSRVYADELDNEGNGEEEAEKQRQEEEERKKQEEEEKKKQEEEAKKKQEEEEKKKQEEEEKKKQKEEEKKKQEEEEKKQQEEEEKKKQEEEEKKKQEEEEKKKQEEEKKQQEEATYKLTVSRKTIAFQCTDEDAPDSALSSFEVTNGGNRDAVLQSGISAGVTNGVSTQGIFRVTPSTATVKPGDAQKFTVEFIGRGLAADEYNALVMVSDQNNNSSSVTVSVTARVDDAKKKKEEEKKKQEEEEKKKQEEEEKKKQEGQVKLTVAAEPAAGGRVAGGGTVEKGKAANIIAVANNGYKFTGWYKDGTQVSLQSTFQTSGLSADATYIARFERTSVQIRLEVDDKKGRVSGGGEKSYKSNIKITAEPKSGYTFEGWYENNRRVSYSSTYEVKGVTEDHTYEARFRGGAYEVSVARNPSDGGSVSGAGKYDKEATVNLKAEPKSGYRFKGWMLNNQMVSGSTSYQIKDLNRDLNFTAIFEKIGATTYQMTAGLANAGGTITPSGTYSIEQGKSITYAIVPNGGYKILAVCVDGVQVGAVSSYTFTDVKANHTISVAFAPKENAVVPQTFETILSTSDVQSIVLQNADASSVGRVSAINGAIVSQPAAPTQGSPVQSGAQRAVTANGAATASKVSDNGEVMGISEEKVEEALAIQEQTLVGMDNAEEITEEEFYDYGLATGVYQVLDITPEEALARIQAGDDGELLRAAYENGYLSINIDNQYKNGAALAESMDDLTGNATLPNFIDVVKKLLTTEEKTAILEGTPLAINFSVADADGLTEEEKNALSSVENVQVGRYLSVVMMKTVGDTPSLVEQLPASMRMVLRVPEELKEDGRQFCVVRRHGGKTDTLEDMDSDPDTITVETDRFSAYAIAYHTEGAVSAAKKGTGVLLFIGIGAVTFAAALLLILGAFGRRRKAARRRR